MKIICSATVSVALVVFSMPLANAAPRAKAESQAVQARALLEDVDSLSASLVDTADRLALGAKSQGSESQRDELDVLRSDINRIGHDLSILQAEEQSLPAWESSTIEEVLPLMQEAATTTQAAIENYNENRNHLWSTDFPDEAARVYSDAERAKRVLDSKLKLAAVRNEEQRIESGLNQK